MASKTTMIDGSNPERGETISVDHSTKEFRIVIRSTSNVGIESMKDLIQQKFEVVEIEETGSEFFCIGPRIRDF